MPGIASATGLLEARTRPVHRPKTKRVELSSFTKPAPLILRPFSGLFNPYPYGCSVLCNHPTDCEAKDVLQRAKNTWATKGKALLLPEEMEMIRENLVGQAVIPTESTNDPATVPEELFRKYTETDSRPLTPAPTLASGSALTSRLVQDEYPMARDLRERPTLVLDLRTNLQKQMENETLTWHALTLEPPPTYRKTEIFISKPIFKRTSEHRVYTPNSAADVLDSFRREDIDDELNSSRNMEKSKTENKERVVIRRRGKRLRKTKSRRRSIYGQQAEICDFFEPTETQISHLGDGSRRTSIHTNNEEPDNQVTSAKKTSAISNAISTTLSSFIDGDILKHLCRELDNYKVEAEFSIRRRIAFEEALRVKSESSTRARRAQIFSSSVLADTPRVFSRQAARFEILGSKTLNGITVLEYLSKHVFVSPGRKLIFAKTFNKFQEDVTQDIRQISPSEIFEALEDVIGSPITKVHETYLNHMIGEIKKPLNFRSWCGLCAAVERLLCPLPEKEIDPPAWLEKVDFENLERRLASANADSKLAQFLREIHEK
ncbi:uncharacterized protein LOC108622521 [Ceratina calcarata]|uniref:Uncharacterized protein LOC108622521 n=1 Tax=Ceratina calcarata TaxID=156304 RepID=A0AAJ7N3J8_9HYME|nr:uncharacterized protein LOC108622521 [Ceratina calcarata]